MRDDGNLEKYCGYDYLVDEVSDRMNRERIHIMFYENRINVAEILDIRNKYPNEIAKFNHIVGLIKFNYHINLHQILIYLMDDGHEMRRLLSILDVDTYSKLKIEMRDIYKIRDDEDEVGLDDFLN